MRFVLAPLLAVALLAGGFLLGRVSTGDADGTTLAAPGATAPAAQGEPQPGITLPLTPTPASTPTQTLARPLVPAATFDLPPPVSISIPDLSIAQGLIELGVTPDLQLEVPTNGDDIGWWNTGPSPGEPGGAVIAAHVSWNGGQPAIFVDLDDLPMGAEIIVDRADGTTATYVVARIERYAKEDFPNELIYRRDGPTQLYVITCAGDLVNGSYAENIVVFADLVGDTRVDPQA
ncbi:MAG: class F sortase [Actinomycetota bacterium]|nr:class F sortase [Actinomycetota bacterium]